MRFPPIVLSGAAFLAMNCGLLRADPQAAQDIAYRMASSYVAKGFSMAPSNNSGTLAGGKSVRLLIPITKGLEYVVLVGGDDAAQDIDVYVYDEVGNLILDDRRSSKYAGVEFHSSYTGSVVVYVDMVKASGQGAYSLLVGRRGSAKENSEAPPPTPAPSDKDKDKDKTSPDASGPKPP